MLEALSAGLVFGLSAGIAPGPLSTLILSQTLRYGPREGLAVAVAPLLTDVPIVAVTLLLLHRAARNDRLLGTISVLGAAYILKLAVDSFRAPPQLAEDDPAPPRSLRQGALVNALSPHPYLFWLTVGGPTFVAANRGHSAAAAAAFLGVFYLLLVGSKVLIALLAGRARAFLTGRAYPWVLRALGLLLALFALLLLRDGWRLLAGGS